LALIFECMSISTGDGVACIGLLNLDLFLRDLPFPFPFKLTLFLGRA